MSTGSYRFDVYDLRGMCLAQIEVINERGCAKVKFMHHDKGFVRVYDENWTAWKLSLKALIKERGL